MDRAFDELLGATARWTAAVRARESANFGRWAYPVIPRTMPDMPRSWYVVARR